MKRLLPLLALLFSACTLQGGAEIHGYAEGEYLYLASPQAGYLQSLDIARGKRVNARQPVFAIAADPDGQALAQAQAQADAAAARLHNLQQPRRDSEIATLQANLRAAQASLQLAATQLQQQQALYRQQFVSQAAVDAARAARDQAAAQVDALRQQIDTYQAALGRNGELQAAAADHAAANALTAQKRWLLQHKQVLAPDSGEITDTYYQPGEWVPAGAPVASLLPDARRRIRFFVPEGMLAAIKPRQRIEARCDGCRTTLHGTVDFIAAQAEYTPPVIYSQGSREKLLFRVEAVPDAADAGRLRPGLPLDIRLVQP
ncbi:HlyD family secretion protein [Vogesella oryzae]|uniref:HlyD family secretion protein n=1 Tax=Vogesella oryzae TaxID=1735285 RepID=UPI0015826EC6|nr:HlyD family secretion protein [Vogesella oryzae]